MQTYDSKYFFNSVKSIKIVESKEKVVAFPLLHKINE